VSWGLQHKLRKAIGLQRARIIQIITALAIIQGVAWSTPSQAIDIRSYPDFVDFAAVQPLAEGGFAVVGTLRRSGAPVGFVRVKADGSQLGDVVQLDPPAPELGTVATNMSQTRDGDFVVSGWVTNTENKQIKPDGWLARISPRGQTLWNKPIPSTANEWDDRFYSVIELASGSLLAVGRTQAGDRRVPSRGFAVWVDADTGEPKKTVETYAPNSTTVRCAFQDITELPDGTLIAVGWATKPDGNNDDVWIARLGVDGTLASSALLGETGVGRAITSIGNRVTIAAGVERQKKMSAVVSVTGPDVSMRTVFALDRAATTPAQLRAVKDIPSTGNVIVAGNATNAAGVQVGFFGSASSADKMSVSNLDKAVSILRSVAIDQSETLVAAGQLTEARRSTAILAINSDGGLCRRDPALLQTSANAILIRSLQAQQLCGTIQQETRFKIKGVKGSGQLGLSIRPLVGDVDAYLMRGNEIIDTSMNKNQRAELLVLPETADDVEVVISAATRFATFELGFVKISSPDTHEADDIRESDHGHAAALRILGYDLATAAPTSGYQDQLDQRAIMSFQNAGRYPVTGRLTASQSQALIRLAARTLEADADRAAKDAVDRVADAPLIDVDRPLDNSRTAVSKIAGSLVNGRFVGIGELNPHRFEGYWRDSTAAGAGQRPELGVLRFESGCSVALQVVHGFLRTYAFEHLLAGSFGVVRVGNDILYAGPLSRVPAAVLGSESSEKSGENSENDESAEKGGEQKTCPELDQKASEN
jgi:hypothetical protein